MAYGRPRCSPSLSHFSFPLPRNKAALPTRHHTRASSTSAPVSRTTFPGDCSLSSTCARVSSSSSRTHTRSARRLFSTIPSRFSPVHPTTHVVRHRRRRPRAAGGSLRPGAEMFRQLAAHDGERKTKHTHTHTHTHTPKPKNQKKKKKKKKNPRPAPTRPSDHLSFSPFSPFSPLSIDRPASSSSPSCAPS